MRLSGIRIVILMVLGLFVTLTVGPFDNLASLAWAQEKKVKVRPVERIAADAPRFVAGEVLVQFRHDMPEQAIAAYNRALAIKPDDTNILNDQGAMYRQTGDFSRALANFEKARQVDPLNLESIYNSGYVLAFDLNQIDRAIVMWRSYLALDKTSETSRQVQSFIERYGSPSGNNARK